MHWILKRLFGVETLTYPACTRCSVEYDPSYDPPDEYKPTSKLCSACVRALAEGADTETTSNVYSAPHDLLQRAAHAAVRDGWDLSKFQDEGAGYFLSVEGDLHLIKEATDEG